MLVVLINNIMNVLLFVLSVLIPNVFIFRNAVAGSVSLRSESDIYEQICIKPTWRLTRLVSPILSSLGHN